MTLKLFGCITPGVKDDTNQPLEERPEAVRARLIRLRLALGKSPGQMAHHLGIEYNRWSNVENTTPLGKELALTIVRREPGVTMDWLWLGRRAGLSVQMAQMLGEIEGPPKSSPPASPGAPGASRKRSTKIRT